MYTSLCDNVTPPVTEQDFHGDLRILFFFVCGIHNGPGDTVSQLVGMRGIYFFKHIVILSLL